MNSIRRLWQKAMSNDALREKLRIIIFQSDTPLGKVFDIALLCCIVASILIVILESLQGMPPKAKLTFTVLEYVFTFFFTLEYLCRLYCSDKPRDYALSFFGIVDLLSTLPLYIGWLFGPVRYLMVVRTFRLIRVFRVFKLFSFLQEGDLLMRSIIIREISSCEIPLINVCSKTCENGPCPMSCMRMAAWIASASESKMKIPFWRNDTMASLIR